MLNIHFLDWAERSKADSSVIVSHLILTDLELGDREGVFLERMNNK